jgi:hypothetical protein
MTAWEIVPRDKGKVQVIMEATTWILDVDWYLVTVRERCGRCGASR